MRRLRLAFAASLALGTAFVAPPAFAVIILDSTWTEYGGSEEDWGAGFDLALELAAEPQFDAVIGFEGQFEHDRHFGCTGNWLGNNADDNAMILTAAHCIVETDINDWTYFSTGGSQFSALSAYLHPLYDHSDDATCGYDFALIELDGPIEDIAEPAVLYAGSDELSYYVVTVGYGKRGTGDYEEDRKFNADSEKAAASNVIDVAEDARDDGRGGNLLRSDFDHPDGDMSTLEGDVYPVDEYEGMMAQGDSGGSGWIITDEGWRLVGVNASTDIMYGYGMIQDHARISTQLDWVLSIYPDATLGE
jgi:hypothetical protein